jgi:hypothetical protein
MVHIYSFRRPAAGKMHYDKPANNPAAKGGSMFAEALRKELSKLALTYAENNDLI